MTRTTIDFGIDLGTTNSAIAVLKGVATEIIKESRDNHEITPSVVHINKKGTLDVGFRAKQRVSQWPDDTFAEFKRKMGSDFVYEFKSSDKRLKAEELSAEVLKSLKADLQVRTQELIEAAVITVPAAFELHQCAATRRAAELAGFKQSPLLQEPVAAALSYGFQVDSEKAYWLVYDFGGGTFDAALIKAEDGTIHVVNHGGDNFLGGSDLDWAIIEKIIVPRIAAEYRLPDFDRAHAGKGGRWREAFARLKFAAEQAKIELSGKEHISLDPSYTENIRDELTGKVVIDDLDLEITQSEIIQLAEPLIRQSAEICQRVLKEKNLTAGAVERVILVGGPTLAPYFRDCLYHHLGIPLDTSVDPLTVVARGAAIFAGTQRLNAQARSPAEEGTYHIEFKNNPVGIDEAPDIGGKVIGPERSDFAGYTLELTNPKNQWRSGKTPLNADGVFFLALYAEYSEQNVYTIDLFDREGRKQKTTPDTFTYIIGVVVDEQPLIKSLGVALAGFDSKAITDILVPKGRALPTQGRDEYRTIAALKRGQSTDVLIIPIVEGEHERADRNRCVGDLRIRSEKISRDLPVGSTVEVQLKIDESRIITVSAYVPMLDEDFVAAIDLKRITADPKILQANFDQEMIRFRDLQTKAGHILDSQVPDRLKSIATSTLLEELKRSVAAAHGDEGAAAKGEKLLLEFQLELDKAEDLLTWPALVEKARQWLAELNKTANRHGTTAQRSKTAEISAEVETLIDQIKMDGLRKKIEAIGLLNWEILSAQPSFWVAQFQRMEKDRAKMTDPSRASRLLDLGRECLGKNNIAGLQNVVRQLWEQLPPAAAQAARSSLQTGLTK